MTKMFCDRCGAEIEKKSAFLTRRKYYTIHRLFRVLVDTDWEDRDTYLCVNCEKAYVHWFEEGRKHDENHL